MRAADVEEVKRRNTRLVVEALKAQSEAVRIVCAIREWVDYEQHLIDTCTEPDCRGCGTRQAMLDALARRLPSPTQSGPGGGDHMRDRELNVNGGEDSGN